MAKVNNLDYNGILKYCKFYTEFENVFSFSVKFSCKKLSGKKLIRWYLNF